MARMTPTSLVVVLSSLAFLCLALPVGAQMTHQHDATPAEKLGRVNFKTSCSIEAQTQFNRAVAWLHSFEYEEAEKAFRAVTVTDPGCGMAHWGIAMCSFHTIWAPPTPDELKRGAAAVKDAKTAGARTERERDYIAAIEVFYKDADRLDHRQRTLAYSRAMEQLAARYPADNEAAVFYALTLIATGAMSNDKSYADQKKAAAILNRILALEPEHPGVTHYLIHSFDYPPLAHLALAAARSYAKIAPASAHARHMPSHIFIRLGLWQEAIRSNLDARAAAKAFASRNHMTGVWDEEFHAMDYLVYAYLQQGDDRLASDLLTGMNKIRKAEPETLKVAYAFTAIPARFALERHEWGEAAKLALPPDALGAFPWKSFPWVTAHIAFARAIGAARSGDTTAARQEVDKLIALRAALPQEKGNYDWGKLVEIEQMTASAWLAFADGRPDEALRLMRAAADLDDATDKNAVTPGAILPAREQLGELLLEQKQPLAALREFETSLTYTPNRFNSLYGAARAASQTGDRVTAAKYYRILVDLCRHADTNRPELGQAKAWLAERDKASP